MAIAEDMFLKDPWKFFEYELSTLVKNIESLVSREFLMDDWGGWIMQLTNTLTSTSQAR